MDFTDGNHCDSPGLLVRSFGRFGAMMSAFCEALLPRTRRFRKTRQQYGEAAAL